MYHLRHATLFVIVTLAALRTVALCGAEADDNSHPLWLAVGKPALIKELVPLAQKRQREGFQTILSTGSVKDSFAAAPRRPDFLLLVGDDEPGAEDQPWHLPAKRTKLYRWRQVQRPEYASDALWGDVNSDLIPDIPVGRIPARTPAQVKLVVEKILSYESRPPHLSDLQLAAWFGSPEYGPAIDSMATRLGLITLRNHGPSWLCPWMITGNPRESFCGVPVEQPDVFSRQLQRGGFCSLLMGHASSRDFCSMRSDGRWIVYNADLAADALAEGPPAPPMFVFSCESGNFAGAEPCMAESFLFFPGGPVATIAASTESHPLTNYFSGVCLMQAFGKGEQRLGKMWLDAQRRALTTRDFLMEMALRDVEGKLEPSINVQRLRRDQMLMYALLGDPATRLRLPRPLDVTVTRTDDGWRWEAERPPGATSLEIGFRTAPPLEVELKARPADPDEARAALQAANDGFRFEPEATLTDDALWKGTMSRAGWLRLVAIGEKDLHVAVVRLE